MFSTAFSKYKTVFLHFILKDSLGLRSIKIVLLKEILP